MDKVAPKKEEVKRAAANNKRPQKIVEQPTESRAGPESARSKRHPRRPGLIGSIYVLIFNILAS